jgi:hypothetical protein
MRSSTVQKHPLQLEFLGPDTTKVPSILPDPSVRVPWAKYYQKVLLETERLTRKKLIRDKHSSLF